MSSRLPSASAVYRCNRNSPAGGSSIRVRPTASSGLSSAVVRAWSDAAISAVQSAPVVRSVPPGGAGGSGGPVGTGGTAEGKGPSLEVLGLWETRKPI